MTRGRALRARAPPLRPLPAEPFDVGHWPQLPGRRQEPESACASASIRSRSATPARASRSVSGAETVEASTGPRWWPPRSGRRQGGRDPRSRPLPRGLAVKPGALSGRDRAGPGPGLGTIQCRRTTRFCETARRRLGDRDGTKALIGVLLCPSRPARRGRGRRHRRGPRRRLGRPRRGGRRSPAGDERHVAPSCAIAEPRPVSTDPRPSLDALRRPIGGER